MHLNSDCVRDVMLQVEMCGFGETTNVDKLAALLTEYTGEEIWYTVLKLKEADFLHAITIQGLRMPMPGIKSIDNLTYAGHEFLDTIRDEKNWGKIKGVAKSAGTYSLSALLDIGKAVATAAIKTALQGDL